MADEQKPTTNADAEKDVQNVLAVLKAESDVDSEEARIVAEAAKLGEKSEQSQDSRANKQQGHRNKRNQRSAAKFDASTQAETDDPVAIRKQVEFYLSDSNLPMDKFLLSKVGGSANNAVPLDLLHNFARMRRFQPREAVVEALKTAETVELVDNNTAVKRKVPLPESVSAEATGEVAKSFEEAALARTIYAKGFGLEKPTTQFDIEKLFAPYGPINAVRLRRGSDRGFKGSVFIEFPSEEKAKEFLEREDKPTWNGHGLLIKSKKQYAEDKVEEMRMNPMKKQSPRPGGRRGRQQQPPGHGRRDARRKARNERDWRDRRDEDQQNGFKDGESSTGGEKRPREEENGSDRPAKKADTKEADTKEAAPKEE